jgi:hypothetical protein
MTGLWRQADVGPGRRSFPTMTRGSPLTAVHSSNRGRDDDVMAQNGHLAAAGLGLRRSTFRMFKSCLRNQAAGATEHPRMLLTFLRWEALCDGRCALVDKRNFDRFLRTAVHGADRRTRSGQQWMTASLRPLNLERKECNW